MTNSTFNPSDAYEKILTANLQRAIDFLKFAETKNAALLALASAWVVAIINLECTGKNIPNCLSASILFALFLSLIAGLLAMYSFMPILHLPVFLGGERAGPHPKNLLYFGDIASIPIKTLENDLQTRYLPDAKGHKNDYLHDLIVQLSVNSDIALRKMRLFRLGMTFIFLSGLLILVSATVMAFKGMSGIW